MEKFFPLEVDKMLAPVRAQFLGAFADEQGIPALHPQHCLKNPLFVDLVSHYQRRFGYADFVAALKDPGILQSWAHVRWVHFGKLIYDVSAELGDVFARTRADFAAEDLFMPAPTVYIAYHQGTIWNEATGEHDLDGFYVSEVEEEGKQVLSIVAVAWPHAHGDLGDNALSSFAIRLPPRDLGTCEDFFDDVDGSVVAAVKLGKNVDRIRGWARIVVGTLVYIASVDRDVETRHIVAGDKIRRRIEGITNGSQRAAAWRKHSLGRVVYVGHRLAASGSKLLVGHHVRTHYRWQRVGAGRAQVKLTLVHGHWRGPRATDDDAPARVYEVENESP